MIPTKIDNLDYGYTINSEYLIWFFIGDVDATRKAARDFIYGSSLLKDGKGRFEHTSEEYQDIIPKRNNAQITIKISLESFEYLVLFFRYCNQIGLQIDVSKFGLLDNKKYYNFAIENIQGCAASNHYLILAKQFADANKIPLELTDYELPSNRNFWLTHEIKENAKQCITQYKHKRNQLKFFRDHDQSLASEIELIQFRLNNIRRLVEELVDSHPKNPNNGSTGIGGYYLVNYSALLKDLAKSPNLLIQYPNYFQKEFALIRQCDEEKFKTLAKKYSKLMEKLQMLWSAEKDQKSEISCRLV